MSIQFEMCAVAHTLPVSPSASRASTSSCTCRCSASSSDCMSDGLYSSSDDCSVVPGSFSRFDLIASVKKLRSSGEHRNYIDVLSEEKQNSRSLLTS